MIYSFINNHNEEFSVRNPHLYDHVYLPLTDAEGRLLSAVTPFLSGDIKKDNDSFLTHPASVEDLKNNLLSRRDFICRIGKRLIRLSEPSDGDTLQAGFLYQKLSKKYKGTAEISVTSFTPASLPVEFMTIQVKNTAKKPVTMDGFSLIYVYARSAENLRDHRHVTSLLQRVSSDRYGLVYQPTMVFNEKGHKVNETMYFVYGALEAAKKVHLPRLRISDYDSIVSKDVSYADTHKLAERVFAATKNILKQGCENCAVLVFPQVRLKPGQEASYTFALGLATAEDKTIMKKAPAVLRSARMRNELMAAAQDYWQDISDRILFAFGDVSRDQWLRWVSIQPVLRKLFGCSFLPHFDYGKGGRGWRDLWQDALTLLLVEPESTRDMIIHNFKGIRIDGSNATIITKDGRFISDRNNISRVWMDHGVWPFLTTRLYIHQTGDWKILLRNVGYYRDHQLKRSSCVDFQYSGSSGLRDAQGKPYEGSILEHILVQLLVQFFNVGDHNIVRLENADWNDGLDMAGTKGESVAFSCMYAANIRSLADMLERLPVDDLEVARELVMLLDRVGEQAVDYGKVSQKRERLAQYFDATAKHVHGDRVRLKREDMAKDLHAKADWMYSHIRGQEWMGTQGFFNGYYDENGSRVEGKPSSGMRMTLTGQVFPIMSGIATEEMVGRISDSVYTYLYDKRLKGFRLNTDFKALQPALGRGFSFVYGDKENGAFFSHMNVMYAYALYSRGEAVKGSFVLRSIMDMALSDRSQMYPNLPEYFDGEGRGKYFYLTGSASWFMFTMLQQVFGIRGEMGDLLLEPKLTAADFKAADAITATCFFAGKRIKVIYVNKKKLNFPDYSVRQPL